MGGTVELMWEDNSAQREEGAQEGKHPGVQRVSAFTAADKRMRTPTVQRTLVPRWEHCHKFCSESQYNCA